MSDYNFGDEYESVEFGDGMGLWSELADEPEDTTIEKRNRREQTTGGLKPCPFCGGERQRVKSSGRWGWFVSCECAAVGPSAGSREEAVERWNDRREPVQGRLDLGI